MDLPTQVQLKLSTQLESRVRDLEVPTDCTLFVPKESDIVAEMPNAGRFYSDVVTSHPDKEGGPPTHLVFNAMFFFSKKKQQQT